MAKSRYKYITGDKIWHLMENIMLTEADYGGFNNNFHKITRLVKLEEYSCQEFILTRGDMQIKIWKKRPHSYAYTVEAKIKIEGDNYAIMSYKDFCRCFDGRVFVGPPRRTPTKSARKT